MNYLGCFDGLVGMPRVCGGADPVIDLSAHAIDETLLTQVTGPEETPATMLAAVEQRARAILNNDVLSRWAPYIQGYTFVDRYGAGQPDDTITLQSGTGIGGILVEVNQPRSNAVVRIGRLGFFGNTTGPVAITIYDLEDASIAATHILSATAGVVVEQDVQIRLPAYRRRKTYFITHDQPDWYRVELFPGCGSCGIAGYRHGGCMLSAGRIAAAVSVRRSNIQGTSHTSGLMATITIECDHGAMLCEIRNALALPYSMKVAEEIIRRGVHRVERMNPQRISLKLLKERADRLGEEYVGAMKNLMGNMPIPSDPFCFACKTPVRTAVVLP